MTFSIYLIQYRSGLFNRGNPLLARSYHGISRQRKGWQLEKKLNLRHAVNPRSIAFSASVLERSDQHWGR